jgi:hypothetical protein
MTTPTLTPLEMALCALSFFRVRHSRQARFKTGQRREQVVSRYRENVRACREYIREARAAGFRGSIRQQVYSLSPKFRNPQSAIRNPQLI